MQDLLIPPQSPVCSARSTEVQRPGDGGQDYSDGSAVPKEDGTYTSRHGHKKPKVTTQGWYLTVAWRDGMTLDVALKDLKESKPIELAQYAIANRIDDKPAFAWWVKDTLQIKDQGQDPIS